VPDRPATDRAPIRAAGPGVSTPVELLRTLAVFAEPPGEEHERLAEVLGFTAPPDASEYSDVFLFQLYPYASVHLGPEGMMGGGARDRVAGFWSALGHLPPAEPDHLATLLGLYVGLAEHEDTLEGAERTLRAQSRRALLHEHLAPWVFAFLDRVTELTHGVYCAWAGLLSAALRQEVVDLADRRSDVLPLHLRVADGLPDPRVEGGAAFLDGLLAPVRTGSILTRADLARFAGDLDLGLRAGERKYALQHLLSQEPVSVLRSVAEEVRRQGAIHARRVPWLGDAAAFFVERARATSALLEELAVEGGAHLDSGAVEVSLDDAVAAKVDALPPAEVKARA
jgi:TorA maturation chaperone TorD